jgi:hypothetical protein
MTTTRLTLREKTSLAELRRTLAVHMPMAVSRELRYDERAWKSASNVVPATSRFCKPM